MIVKIMDVGNGVHRLRLIQEIFVPNLKDQKIDILDTKLHRATIFPFNEELW